MNINDHLMKRLKDISYGEYDRLVQEDRACLYCEKVGSMEKITMEEHGLDDGFTCYECGWKIYKGKEAGVWHPPDL